MANFRSACLFAITALLFAAAPAVLRAQYTNASLGGTVYDPSGAPVAGTKITVTNTDTGLVRTGASGPDGAYLFTALPVGNYKVAAEKPGFSTYVQSGIRLVLNQQANVPITLKVGEINQQVTVAADAELVTTQTGVVGQLVDSKKIVELPLNGRNAAELLYLAAGTVNETGKYCLVNCQGGVYPGETDGNVGGAGPRQVNFQMNGAGHNDTYLNTNLPFPNPDAVQEFNVQTDNLSAQYGMGAGAVVNIITRSGTNAIHGDLFEFVRNGDLNARNFFAPKQDTLKRNQFGGSVGGPIVKDKLFYFGTYQGTRIRSAAQGVVEFVPTAAERAGDFSAISTQLRNPATGTPYINNQIPVSSFSAPSQYFLQHIPLPNGPGNQLTFAGPSLVQNDDQWMIKSDWIHGRNQLTGSYFHTRFNQPPDITSSQTNILAADNGGNYVVIKNLALSDTFSLSPTTLFNTWFGWDDQTGGSRSGAPYPFSAAGVAIAAPTPPEMSLGVGGYFSFSTNHLGNFGRGDYTIREDVTMQRGAHELHVGGEAVRVSNNLVNTYTMSGSFNFSNQLTGNNLADFMLGNASSFLQGGGEFKNLYGTLWSGFIQDNWRVNARLHLNLGLRFDPYFPYTEAKGRVVCFAPGAKSQRFPNAPVGILYGGSNADPGCPAESGSNANIWNFAPRVGFAYRLTKDGKTAIRGGAGIYYTPMGNHDSNGLVDTAPFGPRFSFAGNINFADPYGSQGLPNPFPAQYGPNLPGPDATFTLPMAVYGFIQRDWHLPELATWNLNIERQIGASWVARIGYAGNKGTYLASGALGFREANPAVYIPGASTKANTQQRRLYPQFSNVGEFTSDNNSHYNSLRFNLEKRFSRGFTIVANYTWSKMIDDFGNSGTTDPFNRRFDYGISNDDVPHVFHLSGVWEIPSPVTHGFAGKVASGWELTSVVLWRSGFPYSVVSGTDNAFSGVGNDRADYIGGPITLDTSRSHGALISQYFNTAAFVPNAIGTFGNSGKNILRGPRFFDTDVALLKNTHIKERFNVQFRAEFFNVFNDVNFNNPNNNLASGSYGRITSAADPRILQFGMKMIF